MSESGKAAPQSHPSPSDGDGDGDRVEQLDFANPTLSIIARNASSSRRPSYSTSGATTSTSPSREGTPPPLPPRPQLQLGAHSSRPASSHSVRRAPSRPQLVSKATTQLSITNTQAFGSDSRDDAASLAPAQPRHVLPTLVSEVLTDAEDDTSVKSDVPTISEAGGESMLGEIVAATEKKSEHDEVLLRSLGRRFEDAEAHSLFPPDPDFEAAFDQEFEDVADMAADGSNEGQLCLKLEPEPSLTHITC
jgi:hypothetical protein